MNEEKQVPDFVILNKLGPDIKVVVRMSIKAKKLFLGVGYKGPELVIQNKKSFALGYQLLLIREDWIRKKCKDFGLDEPIDNDHLPILGKKYRILRTDSDECKVKENRDAIEVCAPIHRHDDILISHLKDKLTPKLVEFAWKLRDQYGFHFTLLKLMDNKKVWGHCSGLLVLSFNWRLVFCPPEIVKYLVVHEMCHLVEKRP
ncbi:MAG: DUF45 domain-containing protein [Candidatus Rickettsia vulgarisii]